MNFNKDACITCVYFAYGRLYESNGVSFNTVEKCRRFPKHVEIPDIENHWCGEFRLDLNVTDKMITERLEQAQETYETKKHL